MPPTPIAKLPALFRIFLFLSCVALVWLPFALPLYWLSAQGVLPGGDLLPTALLYLVFLGVLPRWERQVHHLRKPWWHIGFTGYSRVFLPLVQGLIIGLVAIIVLALTQLLLGWATYTSASPNWLSLTLAGGLTALAVGWAEEILFRGWLLRELEQGGNPMASLWGTSTIFALAHFIKPLDVILKTLPQFVGLWVLGALLVYARRTPVPQTRGLTTTSLGYPIGLHAGLVWGYYMLNVGNLLQPTQAVPEWITGLDGNPLAGVLGIGLLGLIAAIFYAKSQFPKPTLPS